MAIVAMTRQSPPPPDYGIDAAVSVAATVASAAAASVAAASVAVAVVDVAAETCAAAVRPRFPRP